MLKIRRGGCGYRPRGREGHCTCPQRAWQTLPLCTFRTMFVQPRKYRLISPLLPNAWHAILTGCSDSTWMNLPVAVLFLLATLLLAKQLNTPPGCTNSSSGHTVRSKLSRTSSSRNLQRPNRSQVPRTQSTAAAAAEFGSHVKIGLHGSERVQRQDSGRGGQSNPNAKAFGCANADSRKPRDWRHDVGSPLVTFAWEKLCNSIVQQVRELITCAADQGNILNIILLVNVTNLCLFKVVEHNMYGACVILLQSISLCNYSSSTEL